MGEYFFLHIVLFGLIVYFCVLFVYYTENSYEAQILLINLVTKCTLYGFLYE